MRAPFVMAVLLGSPLLSATAQAVNSDVQVGVPPTNITVTAPAKDAGALGRITGHIICDDTRRPARGALVMITPIPPALGDKNLPMGREAIAHVRSDGSYIADHLPPGEYTVVATLAGYLSPLTDLISQGIQGNNPAQQHDLLAQNGTVVIRGSETGTFDLTLQRGAAISGQVLYSDGTPAPAVSLLLEDTGSKSAEGPKSDQVQMAQALTQRMFSQQNMTTDDQGHFRLAGLKSGTYRLAAVQSLSPPADAGDNEGMVAVVSLLGVPDPHSLRFYVGDTTHRATAKSFDLHPGDEVPGIQITLPLDAFHELHGTITATDGRSINQGQITLTDTTDPDFSVHTSVAADGTFTVAQIPAGNYTLAAANARITEPAPNGPPNMPEQFRPKVPVAAFADATQSILVQDHDVERINITLNQIPLAKNEPASQPVTDDEP